MGKIPTGLPSVAWPHLTLSELWVLVPSSIGMMLVIFSEALGAGQNFADKHGYRLVPDQEMIALGLANIGSAFLGGLACGGSLSQTAVNDGAGARTEVLAAGGCGLEPGDRRRPDAAVSPTSPRPSWPPSSSTLSTTS